jgi:hypothetical protein
LSEGRLPGSAPDRRQRLARDALAQEVGGGELGHRDGQRLGVERAQPAGVAVVDERSRSAQISCRAGRWSVKPRGREVSFEER